jgi:hypothetical protein
MDARRVSKNKTEWWDWFQRVVFPRGEIMQNRFTRLFEIRDNHGKWFDDGFPSRVVLASFVRGTAFRTPSRT